MTDAGSSTSKREIGSPAEFVRWPVRLLEVAMELLVLLMVCLSPWALGAVGARCEFLLFCGVAVLLVLWAVHMLLVWRVSWKPCPVALCLAAVFVSGIWQLTPLPKSLLERVSPATAQTYNRLLPSRPEVLPFATPREPLAVPAGSTISLYPDATRKSLVELLAVFLLFVIVRNNIASVASLRRLSIAVLVNGTLLSLFGLFQFFGSSEPGMIYWTYPSSGSVFGPFVNRNHFAFYINICIGLGLGLLLVRSRRSTTRHAEFGFLGVKHRLDMLRELLHDSGSLWMSVGLAAMLSSVVFCLSRGGFLALLGASAVVLMLVVSRGPRAWNAGAAVLSVALSLALLIWFGLDRVEAGLSTLWTGSAFQDARVFLLIHAWPLIEDFPIWGTGYGTFQYVEPLQLHTPQDVGSVYLHAHNDYLEDLIEGGLIRLVLRLVAIGAVFRLGYRALRSHSRPLAGAMALGSLFGFTTIVIHSFVEFGLYVPAITVLATVLCANLCALGERPGPTGESQDEENSARQKSLTRTGVQTTTNGSHRHASVWRGGAPALGAATAVWIGYFLYAEGSRTASIEHLRDLARGRRRAAVAGSMSRSSEIPYLQAAARLNPNDAELQFLLAEAHLALHEQQAKPGGPEPDRTDRLTKTHLVPALRHVLQARDLCPLLPAPHARIAFYLEHLDQSDPRSDYLGRTKFLAPADPQLWYFCGLQELADNQPTQAWKSWRRSLELSDRYLTRILDRSATVVGPDDLLNKILPGQPHLLLAAAVHLFPQPESAGQRTLFWRKAIVLFDKQPGPMNSKDLHAKAVLHSRLDQPAEAITAYQAALGQEPLQIGWRFEFAKLLYDQSRLRESRRELRMILALQPQHPEARKLAEVLASRGAEGKTENTLP